MKIENENNEKKRALNIIWNASFDYSFQPEIEAYDEDGKADLYWNHIIGSVNKYYDFQLLESAFKYLSEGENENYVYYENLLWLGLENCTFNKEKNERPALEKLRQNYARNAINKKNAANIFDEIYIAHFQKALGQEPKIKGRILNILNDLEFDESMNTEQIIVRMNEIFKVYFKFSHSGSKESVFDRMVKNRKKFSYGGKKRMQSSGSSIRKQFHIGAVEYSGGINLDEKHNVNKIALHWRKLVDKADMHEREYIKSYFGESIFPDEHTKNLEKDLCDGNHKNCHLHFTRGEFDNKNEVTVQRMVALKQREKNRNHYNENFVTINNNIIKLTNKIRNTMLVNLESTFAKSKSGRIVAGKVWRNVYLNDKKVFIKNSQEDIGDISVDILLDASASQLYRQEIVATEGYIIAESLTRCHIPVRVQSYWNMRDYTIINIFRDYDEINKNNNIFNYNASGFNRDGLAIRTSIQMMKRSRYENKILIILSDGKPNDMKNISSGGFISVHHEYAGDIGVNDTAQEVRKGSKDGISILAVFTGNDEDVADAVKIYGHNLACIKSPERFADTVGVLMQNVLSNF